ncbi:MAG: hypothetical protein O3B24_00895 [Verrucomicrobia bacterium]|nr:hypothetical protein [Verrucomicrobiota bacterium]
MTPCARLGLSLALALTGARTAGAEPAPLEPVRMRDAPALATPAEPQLVAVTLHEAPVIAMPAERNASDPLLDSGNWMRGIAAPAGPAPIVAQQETSPRQAGWMNRDGTKKGDSTSAMRGPGMAAGWLAEGVYAIRAREEGAASRSESDPFSLDIDLDASDLNRESFRMGSGREHRRESAWSTPTRSSLRNNTDADPVSYYGVQNGAVTMPGDRMPSAREQNLSLPAYGDADYNR